MHSFQQLNLETARLLLRPLRGSDGDRLFRIFSDLKVMRYWNTEPWTSPDEAPSHIGRELTAMRTGEYISLGVVRKDTETLIGTCTLFDMMEHCRRAEVGYSLASDSWGNGYMQEALTALLDYAFAELNMNRVEADVDPRNIASVKCLERLGFLREGLLRERWIVAGEVSDTAFYGLLLKDWKVRGKQ
ncbi:MAG: GNAT family N-acetyltransferase [Candidatus Krumholzibacteria bacterium]|nr:GNAT family N-acetyltransferase [Candidatus Krumholzibacteria bacterium]MDH4336923.1 GNAT family N-acetyltransferase [Candidatus Krumholzibacteria bacterium]MDH5269781.1 GNAT family N-acetyltransferase [Candidatus Krumholzibacteria bacterium]